MPILNEIGKAMLTVLEWFKIILNGLKEALEPIAISKSDKNSLLYQATIGIYKECIVPFFSAFGIPEIIIHIVASIIVGVITIGTIIKCYNWLERIWPFRW